MADSISSDWWIRLREKLDQLRNVLIDLDRPVVGALLPGTELQSPSDESPVVPNDAKEWFRWTAGVANLPGQTVDDCCVIPGYYPLSPDESRAYADAWKDALEITSAESLIPFLGAPNGDCYAFAWSAGGYLGIAGFLVGEDAEIEFPSLGSMLDYFLACYQDGAFYVDESGHLTMDPGLSDENIARFRDAE